MTDLPRIAAWRCPRCGYAEVVQAWDAAAARADAHFAARHPGERVEFDAVPPGGAAAQGR
ncbi:MAG: hypothetical protein K6U87_06920 [Firmicutes bacterium]|nr:hypothetical protein [Bacillota bacterium]